jgi:hypothetical protein
MNMPALAGRVDFDTWQYISREKPGKSENIFSNYRTS